MATHDRPPWYIDLWLGSIRAWGNVALELLAWPEAIGNEVKRKPEQEEDQHELHDQVRPLR